MTTVPQPTPPPAEPSPADDALEAAPRVPGEDFSRVAFTAEAVAMLRFLVARHGPLMFHQSGGCCDGSSPMCFTAGEFLTSEADVLLGLFTLPLDDGSTTDIEFWMSLEQFRYWRHTHLTVDIVPGRGSGFSLESPEGRRFLIRSRMLPEGVG